MGLFASAKILFLQFIFVFLEEVLVVGAAEVMPAGIVGHEVQRVKIRLRLQHRQDRKKG